MKMSIQFNDMWGSKSALLHPNCILYKIKKAFTNRIV